MSDKECSHYTTEVVVEGKTPCWKKDSYSNCGSEISAECTEDVVYEATYGWEDIQ